VHVAEFVNEGNESDDVMHGFEQLQPLGVWVQAPDERKLGFGETFLAGLAPGMMPLDAAGDARSTRSMPARVMTAARRRATSGALS
jgi:hypothetical protein